MAPTPQEKGSRRKSIHLFSRGGIPQLNTNDESSGSTAEPPKERKKLLKRSSRLGLNQIQDHGANSSESTKLSLDTLSPQMNTRPKTNRARPSSVFGSLGRKSVISEDGGDDATPPTPTSPEDERGGGQQGFLNGNKSVLHHGEVQTSTSMFRKKKEYLVLTETHLHRFKSQNRASEAFGQQAVPAAFSRSHSGSNRYPSVSTSIGSVQEVQSIASYSSLDMDNGIPLKHIVTAYRVESQKPFHTTEVVYLDEETSISGSMQLMLQDPREADLWHTSIRGAAQKARLLSQDGFPEKLVQFLVNIVEEADDYSPEHFKVFKVVRRAGTSKTPRSSSDDLSKMGLSVSYAIIGINKFHLISVPDSPELSSTAMAAKASKTTWGLLSLVGMTVQHSDDAFELIFRVPLQTPTVLELAASAAAEVVVLIYQAIQYLRPLWLDHTFAFKGPPRLFEDYPLGSPSDGEEYGCFDRTLIAYCAAYSLDPQNICYTVDWHVENAPEFRLLPPANAFEYRLLELLAVLRSLRYNESFHAISFRGVSLQPLHSEQDRLGSDHIVWTSREGRPLHKIMPNYSPGGSLLFQEIRALALKSRKIRRMDFTDTLPLRRPKDNEDDFPDPGSEITRALLPICRYRLTNVDWIILSGIELGETDFDVLLSATAFDKQNYEIPNLCQIRAIEFSRTGLQDRGLQLILSCIERLNRTIQCIDISHNPCRINTLEQFQTTMLRCSQVRKVNLSRVGRPPSDDPLLTSQVLLAWNLEELILDGILINDKSLSAIMTYLESEKSNSLRNLSLNQCNLTGTQVAQLMRSMCTSRGTKETDGPEISKARDLHLHVSTNRLERGNSDIIACIEEGQTPTQLTMRMVEYQREEHFRQLLAALRTNKTIRRLDISKASLPYDASAETCEALQNVFSDNTALEDLDISGEHAHLEVARFGIGLNQALGGLKNNKTLKILTIEYQNLGLEGANTLSTVLETNDTLTHINCANNGINLQGFTVLTNAMAKNFSVVQLPMMQADCEEAVRRMKSQIMDTKLASSSSTNTLPSSLGLSNSKHHKGSGVVNGGEGNSNGLSTSKSNKHIARRTLNTLTLNMAAGTSGGSSKAGKNTATIQDVEQAVKHLYAMWMVQSERLQGFLWRNARIAEGIWEGEGVGDVKEGDLRPFTAMSDRGIIEKALNDTTPKLELGDPARDWEGGSGGGGLLGDFLAGVSGDERGDSTHTTSQHSSIFNSDEMMAQVDRSAGDISQISISPVYANQNQQNEKGNVEGDKREDGHGHGNGIEIPHFPSTTNTTNIPEHQIHQPQNATPNISQASDTNASSPPNQYRPDSGIIDGLQESFDLAAALDRGWVANEANPRVFVDGVEMCGDDVGGGVFRMDV